MNNPSPLVPQGSMMEQKSKARSRVKTAVFCVLALHIIPITMALLMQGCYKKDEAQTTEGQPPADLSTNPVMDASIVSTAAPPPVVENTTTIPPAPGQEYTVVQNDTFSSIAKKFSVTVKAIAEANPGIEPTKLRPGQKLHIPAPAPTTAQTGTVIGAEPVVAAEQTYKVQSGDNLTTIANKFHTTVRALRAANNLTTDRIQVGQILKIPKSSAPAPAPPAPTTASTNPM